jgi:transcriptional regulator with XRE-family HTH domain
MDKHPLKRFGEKVRAERERAGISQEKLADLAGLHRTYIGGVERGERNLGLLNLIKIAKSLGTTPASLLRDLDARSH